MEGRRTMLAWASVLSLDNVAGPRLRFDARATAGSRPPWTPPGGHSTCCQCKLIHASRGVWPRPSRGPVPAGGLFDGSKLRDHYLAELRRVGRRHGYSRVAREVFRNVDSMIAARGLYARVTAPVTLIYGDHDWSHMPEREANLALLRDARSISLPDTGHFAALEQPARVAEVLLDNSGA
jgi:pimeloyl-ACP methyl ester carboxylesterase